MTTIITALLFASLAVLVSTVAAGLGAMLLGTARARSPQLSRRGVTDAPEPGLRLRPLLIAGVALACALLMLSVVARSLLVGHAPWSNLHEFSVAFAAALLGTYLVLARAHRIAGLAPLVALLAAGLVAFAMSLDDRVDPLVPALQQPLLLTIHVGSAVVAYAVAGVAFVAAA